MPARSYYLALAEEAESYLAGATQGAWLARLEEEHDNIRVSLRSALEAGESRDGGAARRRILALLVHPRLPHRRATLDRSGHWSMPTCSAAAAGEGARRPRRRSMRAQGDDATARARYEESLAIRRTLGHQAGIAHSLSNLAAMARDRGDFDAAARRSTRRLWRSAARLGDSEAVTRTLINLGILAQRQGDYAAARAHYEESLAIGRGEAACTGGRARPHESRRRRAAAGGSRDRPRPLRGEPGGWPRARRHGGRSASR